MDLSLLLGVIAPSARMGADLTTLRRFVRGYRGTDAGTDANAGADTDTETLADS
jgi:hypothetical protein